MAQLKCPICGKPVSLEDPYVPFCSERCKLIDLGNWIEERYRIPGSSEEDLAGERSQQEGRENESENELGSKT